MLYKVQLKTPRNIFKIKKKKVFCLFSDNGNVVHYHDLELKMFQVSKNSFEILLSFLIGVSNQIHWAHWLCKWFSVNQLQIALSSIISSKFFFWLILISNYIYVKFFYIVSQITKTADIFKIHFLFFFTLIFTLIYLQLKWLFPSFIVSILH